MPIGGRLDRGGGEEGLVEEGILLSIWPLIVEISTRPLVLEKDGGFLSKSCIACCLWLMMIFLSFSSLFPA